MRVCGPIRAACSRSFSGDQRAAWWHVAFRCGEVVRYFAAQVGGLSFAAVEDLYGGVAVADIHGFSYQRVRDRVVMVVDFDMIIGVDLGPFPLRVFIGCIRERFERRSLQGGEDFRAGARLLAEGLGVELQYQGANGRVEFRQGEELALSPVLME